MVQTLQLSGGALINPVIHDLSVAGGSPTGAIARALHAHLFERVTEELAGRLIKPPVIKPDPGPAAGNPSTLPALARAGHELWYAEVRFSTLPDTAVQSIDVLGDSLLEVLRIDYGQGISRASRFKVSLLKRQTNHILTLNHLRIPGALFQRVLNAVDPDALQQPLLANFCPGPDINGFRTVSFDHVLTGDRTFCSCSKAIHRHMLAEARARVSGYAAGSWPQQMVAMLKNAQYREGMCHLCLARQQSPEEAARRYGANIETGFESYIDQVMFDMGVDRKTARAEIQQVLGLSRWVREAKLYALARELFPDQRILREASPDWLGRMRLDIYLPELKLVLEHQGEQHFRPISAFGGEDAHSRVVERDALKRQLCQANGVEVVDVRYDAALSKASLAHRLRKYL